MFHPLVVRRLNFYEDSSKITKTVANKEFVVYYLSTEDFKDGLIGADFPEEDVFIVAEILNDIRQHHLEVVQSDLEKLL